MIIPTKKWLLHHKVEIATTKETADYCQSFKFNRSNPLTFDTIMNGGVIVKSRINDGSVTLRVELPVKFVREMALSRRQCFGSSMETIEKALKAFLSINTDKLQLLTTTADSVWIGTDVQSMPQRSFKLV